VKTLELTVTVVLLASADAGSASAAPTASTRPTIRELAIRTRARLLLALGVRNGLWS
jgi:hypothetical protein